ncbi:RNA-directed DNA polymerase [Mesorhizobium sp. B3-1-7]|uniref:RNA-directed DNA polymerase n=1 Tax=Mesorhizobium sp. B3-1-7 TaxID=2589894 RepID=UPI00112D5458|nr:RNA-directed DNA polymerase [Mesorhizobium sp. B3-1-7]TPI65039.1 RNA-directed DNA polymerase [Mesorhizobium sp. B3-1-7]
MAYRLPTFALQTSIRHLCRYGDTDVFPHLPELAFVREEAESVVDELVALDLDTFDPGTAVEALGPKSRYGFRIVHQLPYLDTILLLAAVIELGPRIESHRPSQNNIEAFSYRYALNDKGSIFRGDRTFKEWLQAQLQYVQGNPGIEHVIATDISDFYARVNFHRLENLLDEVAPGHGAARYIKKHIKVIRAKQSFGLPVGGTAARLLAELALSDTDNALERDGRSATRFVDDFRIFLAAGEDPYDALAFIAEQLAINEGLSLNVAKTEVYSRAEFLARVKRQTADISDEAEGAAIEALTSDLYFDDEPDEDDVEKLKSMNLIGYLREEVAKASFDMGRIKVIFRALKITKPPEAIQYIIDSFSTLVVFSKEVTLLMQELEAEEFSCFDELSDTVVKAILSPPASSIQLMRTWLLELFVRRIVPLAPSHLKALDGSLSTSLDRRQLHLIRGRLGDKNHFRKYKTAFGQITPIEQPCFIWGASCLPKDEYETFVQGIKPMFPMPTGALFLKWAAKQREKLISKLESSVDEHQE